MERTAYTSEDGMYRYNLRQENDVELRIRLKLKLVEEVRSVQRSAELEWGEDSAEHDRCVHILQLVHELFGEQP
jgi:hypothetical protein